MKTKRNSILFGNVNEPIITSLMEVDTYKFLMSYFVWTYARSAIVTFAFTNRTKGVLLGNVISQDRLQEEFRAVQGLRFTDDEIAYLRGKNIFSEDFLIDLRNMYLPQPRVTWGKDGQIDIVVRGVWYQVMFWETMILAIINQLYAEALIGYDPALHEAIISDGEARLDQKIAQLRKTDIRFLQFGLRRRLSGWWERRITQIAKDEMPKNMIAVSNVALARELGMSWGGTNAHELYSGFYALCGNVDAAAKIAQYNVLTKWQSLYPEQLRVMLPDTFGSKQFLERLPRDIAQNFRGARQDSGDPIVFGNMLIDMYKRYDIDPRQKTVLFSDGLTVAEMLRLYDAFSDEINVLFGWGTNLTFDTMYLKPISIVMKLVEANGFPAVKLSDNLAKAVGEARAVARAKEIFGYTNTFVQQCVY